MISQISAPLPEMSIDSKTINNSTRIDIPEPMQMLFESHNEDIERQIDMDSAFTEDMITDFDMTLNNSEGMLFDSLLMDLNVGECDAHISANLVIDDEELMSW
jgi:hypothetical protein